MKHFAFSIAFFALSSPAHADMTTDDFTEYLDTSPQTRAIAYLYIGAAYSAFQMANIALEERGDTPLFCMPSDLLITEEQLAQWVANDIEMINLPRGSDVPVTIAVRSALETRFPC